MKCQFFIVHALNPSEGEAELNGFLAQVKLVNVEKQFVADGSNSFWSVCVNYVSKNGDHKPRKGKVDYREVLNETDFALYFRT